MSGEAADAPVPERPRKKSKWDDQDGSSLGASAGAVVPPLAMPGYRAPLVSPTFKVVTIPASQKGALIGRGGMFITAIRQASMSEIKVTHNEGEPMATITITGNVPLAEKLITEQLAASQKPKGEAWDVKYVDVPQELIGQTIGAGGSSLREMQEKCGCKMAFVPAAEMEQEQGSQAAQQPSMNSPTVCRIKGPADKVIEAERILKERVAEIQQTNLNKTVSRWMKGGPAAGKDGAVPGAVPGTVPGMPGTVPGAMPGALPGAMPFANGGKGKQPWPPFGKGKGGPHTANIPCRYQMKGHCRNGDTCNFSHDPALLAQGNALPETPCYKMTYCKFWDSGKCSRGAACTWAHGVEELRGPIPERLRQQQAALGYQQQPGQFDQQLGQFQQQPGQFEQRQFQEQPGQFQQQQQLGQFQQQPGQFEQQQLGQFDQQLGQFQQQPGQFDQFQQQQLQPGQFDQQQLGQFQQQPEQLGQFQQQQLQPGQFDQQQLGQFQQQPGQFEQQQLGQFEQQQLGQFQQQPGDFLQPRQDFLAPQQNQAQPELYQPLGPDFSAQQPAFQAGAAGFEAFQGLPSQGPQQFSPEAFPQAFEAQAPAEAWWPQAGLEGQGLQPQGLPQGQGLQAPELFGGQGLLG